MRVDGCVKAKQSSVLILGSMKGESVRRKGQRTSLIREEIRPADSSKEAGAFQRCEGVSTGGSDAKKTFRNRINKKKRKATQLY